MTALKKLNVSLTKHGAHKVATLLKKYDKDQILSHLKGSEPGINIELAQARKNLSANSKGVVPALWNKARQQGPETIDALVLVGIIFSHYKLISAMQASSGRRPFSGRVIRGNISDKEYWNLAHTIEELGYSTEHSKKHIDYDLHKLFQINGLNELVAELLKLKLESASWTKKNSLLEESIALGFHNVFSVSKTQFSEWLSTGKSSSADSPDVLEEDLDYFFNASDDEATGNFVFHPGHSKKKTGTVKVKPSKKEATAILLHNEIQNSLFAELVKQYGKDCVGTENKTGQSTSIDIVVKTAQFCWFYEIKTADTVKACIRQALPQLLEYAYWHGNDDRANRLIIVSPLRVTKQAETYLSFLRKKFGLEIYYEQYQVAVAKA